MNTLYFKNEITIFNGVNTTGQMVKTLQNKINSNEHCILNAFNGQRFDFYPLAKTLTESEVDIDNVFCK